MGGVVFFDIDGTLVHGQTQKMLAKYLFKKNQLNFFLILKIYIWFIFFRLYLIKDAGRIMENSYKLVQGKNTFKIEKLLNDFFDKEVKDKIFPAARTIIERHRREGRKIILISNTIQPIVNLISKYLKVESGFGTKLEEKDGFYTGNIIDGIMYGERKAKFLKNLIGKSKFDFDNSYAYSDHYSDLPVLEMVKNPVVVNPDKKLAKIAIKNNWSISKFIL